MAFNSRIKSKIGICIDCPPGSEPTTLIAKKKCYNHYWGPKRKTPIAKKSETQKERDKRYYPIRNKFIKERSLCMIKVDGCTKKATDVHHPEGKIGELYFDDSKFIAACRNCHRWAEEHPTAAKELGVSADRLNVK